MNSQKPQALYIHVPFCLQKCNYCSFYSVYPYVELVEQYLKKIQLDLLDSSFDLKKVKTVFIGGGNPTSIGAKTLFELLDFLLPLLDDSLHEFTIETNPETLTKEMIDYFSALRQFRLSVGIQRLNEEELIYLGRKGGLKAIYSALDIAFGSLKNISCDLILGIPNFKSISKNLEELLKMYLFTHISTYLLSIEENTVFEKLVSDGKMPHADDVGVDELIEVVYLLQKHKYSHYEISNFALRGRECKHNLAYWSAKNYIGLGPAAVSTFNATRTTNIPDLAQWLKGTPPLIEKLSIIDLRNEYLMLALRLLETGIDLNYFENQFGKQPAKFYNMLSDFSHRGWLIQKDNYVRLSPEGISFADNIISELFI